MTDNPRELYNKIVKLVEGEGYSIDMDISVCSSEVTMSIQVFKMTHEGYKKLIGSAKKLLKDKFFENKNRPEKVSENQLNKILLEMDFGLPDFVDNEETGLFYNLKDDLEKELSDWGLYK